MKSMHNKDHVAEMKKRVERLTSSSTAQWGVFSIQEMICHLLDGLKYPLGMKEEEKELAPGPPLFIRSLIRLYMPIPKAKIKTVPLYLETKPEEFEKDKAQLVEMMDRFLAEADRETWPMHPFFGNLDGPAWGKLTWRHMSHHLCQFGV